MADREALPVRRLEQLTSLRFFAALAVLTSHLWPLAEDPNPLQPVATTLFHEGYAGVSFFFMLSGFILSHTYQGKLVSGAISRGKYLALRIARIAPLHWLLAVPFAVAAFVSVGRDSLPSSLLNILLLQSWVPNSTWYFTLVGPSWSLSDEAFFYSCFAGLAFLSLRRLALFAGVLLAADVAMVAVLVASGHGAIGLGQGLSITHWLTYILPVTRLLDFVLGMLLYRLPRPVLGKARGSAIELGAVALVLGAMVAFITWGLPEAVRMQLAYLPFMALMIWAFACGNGVLARGMGNSRALVLLGDASFALYLIHLPLIQWLLPLNEKLETPLPVLAICGLVTLLAISLSIGVFRLVEKPLLRASRRWIDRKFPR